MNLSSIKELRIIKTDTQFERTNYRVLANYTDIGVYSNGYVGNITTASEHSINDALKHFNELSDILVKDICYVSIRRKEGDRYQVFYRYDTGEHAKTQFVHVNYRGDLLSKLSEYFNMPCDFYPTFIGYINDIDIQELVNSIDMSSDDRREDIESLLENLTDGGDVQYQGEWYPDRLIAENNFTDYIKELVSECYNLDDVPNFVEINWEATACNCKIDYSAILINGTTYYYR